MPALALDDPRWRELSHAYGAAADLPAQLRALAQRDTGIELFFPVLCHQGTVYTATYAAVPHLVAIAAGRPWPDQLQFWTLVGAVASSRDAPPVPADLAEAFEAAVARASELAPAGFVPGLDESDATWLAVAVAGLRRQHAIADAVEGLCGEELAMRCPRCKRDLYVTLVTPPFAVHADDPARGDVARTTVVTSLLPRAEIRDLAALAQRAGCEDLAARLLALDGRAPCPACDHGFAVLDVCG